MAREFHSVFAVRNIAELTGVKIDVDKPTTVGACTNFEQAIL